MASLTSQVSSLRRILAGQLQASLQLKRLAEDLSQALVAGRPDLISAAQPDQRRWIETQTALEAGRAALAGEIARTLGVPTPGTLLEVLRLLPPVERRDLVTLRRRLLAAQRELVQLSEQNQLLLETALDITQVHLQAITTAVLKPAPYGANLAQIRSASFYIDSRA